MDMDAIRNKSGPNKGQFPHYVWPGGYPLVFMFEDNEICCPACANGENGSDAYVGDPPDPENNWHDPQRHLVAYFIHYEGEPEICNHCREEIESAYGPLEKD